MKLRVVKKPSTDQNVRFPEVVEISNTAGQSPMQLGRYRGNDIVLPDVSVSRRHAELRLEDGAIIVSDLNSKFGTFINKRRLTPYTKTPLLPTDTLQIGKIVLMIEELDSATDAADGGGAHSDAADSLDSMLPLVVTPEEAELQAAADEIAAFVGVPETDSEPMIPPAIAQVENIEVVALPQDDVANDTTTRQHVVDNTVDNDRVLEPDNDDATLPQAFVAAPDASDVDEMAVQTEVEAETALETEALPETESDDAFVQQSRVLRVLTADPLWLPWLYLVIITVAELVTAAVNVQVGLGLHTFILLALVIQGALSRRIVRRNLLLSLAVAPLIRILSLSLPLVNLPQLTWYPLVATPLLIAAWIIARQLGVSRQSVGLRFGGRSVLLQVMLAGGGLGLGLLEYLILHPKPLVSSLTWQALALPALSLLIFTGFNEEIIFRGLLQSTAKPSLHRWGLLYVSLLFAALHVGYLSLTDVVFVFVVGLLFAYIVQWSGSIFGVTLTHGMTNITLFLLAPYLAQNPNEPLAAYAPTIVAIGVGCALLSLAFIIWRSGRNRSTTRALAVA